MRGNVTSRNPLYGIGVIVGRAQFMKKSIKGELHLLVAGETLEKKTRDLLSRHARIANASEIKLWLEENPHVKNLHPIVIADPLAEPRCYDLSSPIVHVPAHSFIDKGAFRPDGWVDLLVPMHPKEAGGQLAILELLS
jgi:hypothetical protein